MDGLSHALLQAAVESFGEDITAMEGLSFFKTLDATVLRIFRSVSANLSRFGEEFRRSELRVYVDAHAHEVSYALSHVEHLDKKLLVAIPEGMIKTYDETASVLAKSFKAVDVKAVSKIVHALLSKAMSVPCDSTEEVKTFCKESALDIKTLQDLPKLTALRDVKSLIGKSRLMYRPLGRVFSSPIAGIKSAHRDILAFDPAFLEASRYRKTFDAITGDIAKILTKLELASDVKTEFVQAIFSILTGYTWMVDFYGILLHEAQKVEHNYVIALKTIVAASKTLSAQT